MNLGSESHDFPRQLYSFHVASPCLQFAIAYRIMTVNDYPNSNGISLVKGMNENALVKSNNCRLYSDFAEDGSAKEGTSSYAAPSTSNREKCVMIVLTKILRPILNIVIIMTS